MMKVAFFTEAGFTGTPSRNEPNRRTEIAWYIALQADHFCLFNLSTVDKHYDLGIVILPKTKIDQLMKMGNLINDLHIYCDKVAIMQEGPHWYFQDYPLDQQIWYYNTLMDADLLFCHNEHDVNYYRGMTGKQVEVLQSLMITDELLDDAIPCPTEKVMIGGNMCSWYGGFDSMIVANEFDCPIHVPSMGRKIEGEDRWAAVTHLPYMTWVDWMVELSKYKYAVHLMRTAAAGTFSLNCAYWGIPCIGYNLIDTQQNLHPLTSVELGDIEKAREIAKKLRDPKFYELCQKITRTRYNKYYTEKVWLKKWSEIENRL